MIIQEPLVSIVTATFNSIKYIDETKKSVLDSDYKNIEWVVIDDKSTDGTCDYLQNINDPRLKLYLKHQNTGIRDSYSIGISHVKGKYILILDHDDTIPSGSLAKRVESLERNTYCNSAYGLCAYMDKSGYIYAQSNFPFVKKTTILKPTRTLLSVFLWPLYPIKQGCFLMRSKVVREYPDAYDIELFLCTVSKSNSIFIAENCLNYRTFRQQYSSSRSVRFKQFFQFYWVRYALRFLPWYISPPIALYRVFIEFLKVIWSFFSAKRI